MHRMNRKTILIVDDDHNLVLALMKRLEAAGYRVLTAASGEEAMDLAHEHDLDAIILDVSLEGRLGGLEVSHRLSRDPRTARFPVIFLTGSAGADFRRKCVEAGGAYFIAKPHDAEVLLKMLETIFARDELSTMEKLLRAKRRQPTGLHSPSFL